MDTKTIERNLLEERKIKLIRIKQQRIDYRSYSLNENQVILMSHSYRPYLLIGNEASEKYFLVDKNMKILIPHELDTVFPSNYLRLPDFMTHFLKRTDFEVSANDCFIVIDQKKLLESEGKKFVISYKSGMSYKEILSLQKYYIMHFTLMRNTAAKVKDIVGSVYDEDHYDIVFNFNSDSTIGYTLILKHDNITITNSIEQSRFIGTIFTYLHGVVKDDGSILIVPMMRGTRTTYRYKDIVSGYVHSHLPRDAGTEFSRFCLGHDNDIFSGLYANRVVYSGSTYLTMNDLELEGLILAIQDYVQWESLEGGPHHKLEEVSLFGRPIETYINGERNLRTETYMSSSKRNALVQYLLQENNLKELKSAFLLTKKGSYHTFIFNQNIFIERIIRLINKNIRTRKEFGGFVYDPTTGKISQMPENPGSAVESIVTRTKRQLIPSYINGKILSPEITIDEEEKEILENTLVTLHPLEYIRIGNAIVRLLNKEILKNEYRKK